MFFSQTCVGMHAGLTQLVRLQDCTSANPTVVLSQILTAARPINTPV